MIVFLCDGFMWIHIKKIFNFMIYIYPFFKKNKTDFQYNYDRCLNNSLNCFLFLRKKHFLYGMLIP